MNEKENKRVFDVVLTIIILVLLFPLVVFIVILLLVFTKRPLFFKQERVGRNGKTFLIYKFRSMKIDSEKDGNPKLAQCNDIRETIIGRFMRRHHLDEIPQFWNVLKGDMSIVGPRSERQFYINQILKFNSRYKELYQVRPGLTSYATLHNGYTDTLEKMLTRLEMDLDYLEQQSFTYDLRIIVDTVVRMIIGEKKKVIVI